MISWMDLAARAASIRISSREAHARPHSYTKPPTFSALFFSLTRTATRQTCLPGSRRSWRDERARQVARLVSWSAGLASGALMPGAGDGGRRYL